ncbi:MAG: hypothetical protein ACP5I3_02495 [Thermoproteus sp.]
MDADMVEAYAAIGVGAALVAFAVAAAALLYLQKIPETTITVQTGLGQLNLGNMPDPRAVAAAAIRALALIAIGLTGGKLLEIGLKERREARRERELQRYYQQYYYYQQY